MPYLERPVTSDLLHTAHRWESLRSVFWERLNPELSRECRTRADGHFLRMQMEERQ